MKDYEVLKWWSGRKSQEKTHGQKKISKNEQKFKKNYGSVNLLMYVPDHHVWNSALSVRDWSVLWCWNTIKVNYVMLTFMVQRIAFSCENVSYE